ncbi:MAG: NAD(P)-dependent methylenetetrahydromethanopterin dehydrogenase [Rubrivivax sp.]
MDRPYVLHIFTPGSRASPFDVNMAADAGWQIIVPYPDVGLEEIEAMTQDTIFSRGLKGVARTGVFIGGRDALMADAMLDRARRSMFKPFVVSLMADPSGAYTTAAAMVARVDAALIDQHGGGLAGRSVVVLGGLGPVGRVAGVLAARLGARVALSSRGGQAAAEAGARQTGERFGVELHGASGADAAALRASIADAEVVLACAAAGVQVLTADDLAGAKRLRVAADLNAVAPAGIAGIGVMDDGAPLVGTRAIGIGALAVGNIKYQTQHRLLLQLRDSEKPQVLGLVEAFEMARSVVAEQAA